jgi:uncharacterized protein
MTRIEVYWAAIGTPGLEHLDLQARADGITADGMVLRYHDGRGLRLWYRLNCDSAWRTRELSVKLLGEDSVSIWISADEAGNWFDRDGHTIEFLTGCIDVDLMTTPFTNTLPIKRLDLLPGESKEIEVVYVRVPDLNLLRAGQRYTCLEKGAGESRYVYESLDSDFKAELVVDEEQLVVSYQGIWERVGIFKIS